MEEAEKLAEDLDEEHSVSDMFDSDEVLDVCEAEQ